MLTLFISPRLRPCVFYSISFASSIFPLFENLNYIHRQTHRLFANKHFYKVKCTFHPKTFRSGFPDHSIGNDKNTKSRKSNAALWSEAQAYDENFTHPHRK